VIAPVATLPAAENDSRPARPAIFPSASSAHGHAIRSAIQASASGAYRTVEGVRDCYEPIEGGIAFAVQLGVLHEWHVVTFACANYRRLVEAGIRGAVSGCLERARANDLAAQIMKPGSSTRRMHEARARQERDRARDLQLLLTVSVAS
jgi:hypothetical protein